MSLKSLLTRAEIELLTSRSRIGHEQLGSITPLGVIYIHKNENHHLLSNLIRKYVQVKVFMQANTNDLPYDQSLILNYVGSKK